MEASIVNGDKLFLAIVGIYVIAVLAIMAFGVVDMVVSGPPKPTVSVVWLPLPR